MVMPNPYEQGRMAAMLGYSRDDNPYIVHTELNELWYKGFDDKTEDEMHQQVDTEELEAEVEWWKENAVSWREQCEEAWRDRDYLRERCQWLEKELVEERGYL